MWKRKPDEGPGAIAAMATQDGQVCVGIFLGDDEQPTLAVEISPEAAYHFAQTVTIAAMKAEEQ